MRTEARATRAPTGAATTADVSSATPGSAARSVSLAHLSQSRIEFRSWNMVQRSNRSKVNQVREICE